MGRGDLPDDQWRPQHELHYTLPMEENGTRAMNRLRSLSVVTGLTKTVLLLTLAAFSVSASALEHITRFHVEIDVLEDGRLEVTERIYVVAEGKRIKRGIYRDLKLSFTDLNGNSHAAGYEVLEVTRDGAPENWFTERSSDSLRIYLGQKSVLLNKGEYGYTIRYLTDYQLGFGPTHDSLYWNVTGNDWDFLISSASAEIRLPSDVNDVQFAAFTGALGSTDEDATVSQSSNILRVKTLSSLPPREGLTIRAKWPAGSITRPEGVARFRKLPGVSGILHTVTNLIGNGVATVIALALALIGAGRLWGREPAIERSAGVRSNPPLRLGPAATRWVERGSYDAQTLKAALVSLAAKGRLMITEEEKDGIFGTTQTLTVEKIEVASGPSLTNAESAVFNTMFAGRTQLPISRSEFATWERVSDALELKLEADYESEFFDRNTDLMFKAGIGAAVLFGLWMLIRPDHVTSWMWVAILSVVMVLIFCACINSRTSAGAQAKHEIDRFKRYLEGDYPNPPPIDAKQWGELLPYAIALDVTEQWTERAGSGSTQPSWYSGSRFASLGITKALTGLDDELGSSVARSSRPESSSSSGGGGGSSGGGGGGGGGGGW